MIVSLYSVQYCGSFFPDPMSRCRPYSRYSNTVFRDVTDDHQNNYVAAKAVWQRLHQKLEVAAFGVGGKVAAKRSPEKFCSLGTPPPLFDAFANALNTFLP